MERWSEEKAEHAALVLNLSAISNDDVYKHNGKRKNEADTEMLRLAQTGLEEASAPEHVSNRRQKWRSNTFEKKSEDEEEKQASVFNQLTTQLSKRFGVQVQTQWKQRIWLIIWHI